MRLPSTLALCLLTGSAAATDFSAGIAIAAKAQFGQNRPDLPAVFANGVRSVARVIYAEPTASEPLTLDLYLPAQPLEDHPVLVYLHGGGWSAGDNRTTGAFIDFPQVLARFAGQGYAVASLNYRLDRPFPAALMDVRQALQWLQTHASDYGLDIQRMALWGSSAGGQLAALAATTCAPGAPCAKAWVGWFGVYDFSTLLADPRYIDIGTAARRYLACRGLDCDAAVLAAASPLQQVANAPRAAALLLHGDADQLVPDQQSATMALTLEQAGHEVQLGILAGVGHSFVGSDPARTRAANVEALETTARFLAEHL